MNPNATSKANILKTSRELIQQNGWAGVNIRSVAAACGVSVGCIYNYFASKTELLSATVESIWSDIFHHPEDEVVFQDTLSCVRWMYQQLEDGCQRYPGFFTHHALGFVRQDTADRCGVCRTGIFPPGLVFAAHGGVHPLFYKEVRCGILKPTTQKLWRRAR